MTTNNRLMNDEVRKANAVLSGKTANNRMKWFAKRIGQLSKQKSESAGVRIVALREYLNGFNNIDNSFRRNAVSALNRMALMPANKRQAVANQIKAPGAKVSRPRVKKTPVNDEKKLLIEMKRLEIAAAVNRVEQLKRELKQLSQK